MTATINDQGDIVLEGGAERVRALQPGDLFIAEADANGRIILHRHATPVRDVSYLNPPPPEPGMLEALYDRPSEWDGLEEAVAKNAKRAYGVAHIDDL